MEAVLVREGAVLSYETVADPDPGPGEAIVELKAAAVNRRDLLVRQGVYPFPLPLIPGSDGAGIRRDTGEEVVILPSLNWGPSEAAAGESFEILGGPRNGTYAQLIAIPAENLYPKPARLSWEEAAAFPLAALTAYRALFAVGRLTSEECVLVLGAGSGVSTFAVQLAAEFGARVLVTSSSQDKIDRAVELGAKGGFLYTEGDWAEAAREATGGRGVDLVLDSVGSTWPDSVRALGRGRPGRRLRRHGRHRGAAERAPVLPPVAFAARDDDGQPGRLPVTSACDRDGPLAPGDRLGAPARRGRGGAHAHGLGARQVRQARPDV